ncbi:MAG: tryptophan synthase subunit alpha [Bacillota bacterium]|nr:tryptophan synthase subunit alpha [Bacillota bacterium]
MSPDHPDFFFSSCESQSEKRLVAYLCAGDPDLEKSVLWAQALVEGGADCLELGVPFSDPLADGPVIQAAAQRALAAGVNLEKVLGLGEVLMKRLPKQVPLVLMSYLNPILQYGTQKFATDLASRGFRGAIIVDLPYEEGDVLRDLLSREKISLIPLVAPTTREERLQKIVRAGTGFVYCISVTGVTGPRDTLDPRICSLISRIKDLSTLPAVVGFGVSKPEQAAAIASFADGIVVGSAFIRLIGSAQGDPEAIQKQLKELAENLKNALTQHAR